MDYGVVQILESSSFFQVISLLAAGLFFFMVAVRELKSHNLQGLLFLVLAVFFVCTHLFVLTNICAGSQLAAFISDQGIWAWVTLLLAPTIIAFYILFGLFSLVRNRVHQGLVKVFFGLTLLCYLYMLGQQWPVDVRGILVLIWSLLWFRLEFRTTE